jgi:DHA2 family multidrug resistance protein
MSAATVQAVPLTRRSVSPWLIALAVVIPTFMEVLDTTVANVALRYIAGGLSAASVDSEWVITSYLAANAIILPISGWLAVRLGRRTYFLLSIAVFTLASALCGMAGSVTFIIGSRVVQGLAGGGLQPSSQAVLLDAFPQEKQGQAMTVCGVAALLAPVVGPTLGGYITDTYGWRWIFYLNVPIGILAFLMCRALVTDPEYLQAERARNEDRRQPFDTLGLCLLAVTMVCWEVMLSKGQQWDWFGDPFFRVQTLFILFVLGLSSLIYRELPLRNPLIALKTLADRNFATCCIVIFCAYGVLYANTISIPALLQSLFGYDATTSGLVL